MHEDLTNRFAEFFEALWQQRPFAWQQALAERVLSNDDAPWPQAVALPTAAGKTACIDIAVFALAVQASRLATDRAITAPRRIFFVVDRRVIVDEAFDRARRLACRLKQADTPIVKQVADNLRILARGPGVHTGVEPDPLQVFELRGGMYRSEAWARSPLQPLVVASTVDQFGSRLLFRAYGRGSGMWPVYAGSDGQRQPGSAGRGPLRQALFANPARGVALSHLGRRPLTGVFFPGRALGDTTG
jgi:CRISPR-associated endonuclease/helicase Cas3